MARRAALLLLCPLLALAGCEAKDPVILKLAGEKVRRSEFERHVAGLETRGQAKLASAARAGVLDAFLEERALVIEARRRRFVPVGATPEQEAEGVSRLLASAVPEPEVSEQEIAAWHATHATEPAPERVWLRQILVGSLNEARDVLRRLGPDPRTFDTLARDLSKGPEAAIGGYMGVFERGQLPPELEAAAFSLPEGGTSEPVQTALGYHVLRVESRQAAREIPLDEARERIRDHLARDKRLAAERRFVSELMARAKVDHEAALRPARHS